MASASLAAMHTACVRLRDSLDRWLQAFEAMAHEAAAAGVVKTEPARKTLRSPGSVQIQSLAGSERGITAAELVRVMDIPARAAGARLSIMASRGHLVRVALPGQTVRYFAHAEHATAWGASAEPPEPQAPAQLADMVAGAAAAVEKAMAVLAPAPATVQPREPRPAKPKPERKLSGWQENTKLITVVPQRAPVKPAGDVVVPPTAKITVAPRRADTRFTVEPGAPSEGAGFTSEWRRLRGESEEACNS